MTARAAPEAALDWVTRHCGLRLLDATDGSEASALADLVAPALRRNRRRAHLLVSRVLGKHIPVDPTVVHEAGLALGRRVAELAPHPALVIGYAETATALGHCVAEALGADYLHSTRRAAPGVRPALAFEEPHSHATGHLLLPSRPAVLWRDGVIVLVDDELTTATTAMNTVAALQRLHPRSGYVLAALVDLRDDTARAATLARAAELGTTVQVVALGTGRVQVPPQLAELADRVATTGRQLTSIPAAGPSVIAVPCRWPRDVPEGGRHGLTGADHERIRLAARDQAGAISPRGGRILVLGVEELMYAPLQVALALRQRLVGAEVRLSSTTRSPVVVLDEPGYPIRYAVTFPSDDPDAPQRYAYNVVAGDGWTDIVVVADETATGRSLDALIAHLRPIAQVHLLVLPERRPARLPPPLHGPGFGSYPAEEVAWLLTDLSDVALEAPIDERERAVQTGRAHYAESLPIEYQPTEEYQALFARALATSARRVAVAVGVVTELVLDARGPGVVLASLARAGTPIGVLMRRWARRQHGVQLPHYAVSIVRGRGIDPVALRAIAARHDPADVMFVDGWTGKGAIVRELRDALAETDPRFACDLAVLADPGSCVRFFGTRDDFLVPSACLNSTVSGLVSRTVLNDRYIGPGDFHGAKFYRQLAGQDVSALFIDAIAARFADVADDVARCWTAVRDSDRAPTWTGWQAVESISDRYGLRNVNLVKPGVGETTRVLLRRVPWRVLVRPDARAELAHVLLLADQRGVPIEPVRDLPYSCVGLIRPVEGDGVWSEQ